MEKNVTAIINEIPTIHNGDRFILGIDGLSRSGKTTLSKKLRKCLEDKGMPFQIFHIDDHIVEREKRYNTGHEPWYEYYTLQWDIGWLNEHFFNKLRSATTVNLPFYDKETDTHRVHKLIFPPKSVIIIEGIFLQREEWRLFFDYVVYLDCPRQKRFLRESNDVRKNIFKFQTRYWKAEDHYVKTVIPKGRADLMLEG